jgi:uncharacterized protein (DUF302 family)
MRLAAYRSSLHNDSVEKRIKMMGESASVASPVAQGVESVASSFGFAETLDRLESTLRAKNVEIFARIDHAAAAASAGLAMPPTVVLIFGNPRGGTPLMLQNPLLALDLPLKVLVRADDSGQTWVSCNAPGYLAQRYTIPPDQAAAISGVPDLIAAALST